MKKFLSLTLLLASIFLILFTTNSNADSENINKIKIKLNSYLYESTDFTDETGIIMKDSKDNFVVIPAGTELEDIEKIDLFSRAAYVKYEGISGYIDLYDCAVEMENTDEEYKYEVNYDNCKIYEKPRIDSNVLLKNIPSGTKLDTIIYQEYNMRGTGWLYVTYNGVTGWVLWIDPMETFEDYVKNYELPNEPEYVKPVFENETEDEVDWVGKVGKVPEGFEDPISPTWKPLLVCFATAIIVTLIIGSIIILINKKK